VASILHCGKRIRAKKTRLESVKEAYAIQWSYSGRCRHCQEQFVYWQGEDRNGKFTQLLEVTAPQIPSWLRRIEAGDFKPEPQFISEYSRRVAGGNALSIGQYHSRLCDAKSWYGGKRVQVELDYSYA
jgi:hypothetical protein